MALSPATETEETGKWKDTRRVFVDGAGAVVPAVALIGDDNSLVGSPGNPLNVEFLGTDNLAQIIDDSGNQTGIASNPFYVRDYYFEIGEGNIPNKSFVHKFGRNPDIDSASGFEAIWNGGGDYTGFNAVDGEAIEVFSSSAADVGALVSSGTATSQSATQLIDTGATFVSDGVAVGDVILDDTQVIHGIVSAVTSETVLTVARFDDGGEFTGTVEIGDAYRVATASSTGAAAVNLGFLLDSDFDNQASEFIILNGTTGVLTTGTDYIRNSRHKVLIAGSGGSNAGSISSRQATTTANIFTVMPIGYNSTMIAAYTIPKTKEGHLVYWKASLSGKKTGAFTGVRLMVKHRGEVFRVEEETSLSATGTSADPRDFIVPKNSLPGGSDIKIMADSDTNDLAVSAMFSLILSTE